MTKLPTEQEPAECTPGGQVTRRGVLKGGAMVGATLAADPRLVLAGADPSRDTSRDTGVGKDTLIRAFQHPPDEYRPVDNYWWESGSLNKEKLKWQLEQFKEKGIGGAWFYVRWVYGEPLGTVPAYWSDEWWEITRFVLQEQKRLGLEAWFSIWEINGFIQNRVREEAERNPELKGRNLVIHRVESEKAGLLQLALGAEDEILDAAAYRKTGNTVDYGSRVVLSPSIRDGKLEWKAPGSGWLLTAIAAQPEGVNYLNPAMAQRWNEVFLGEYEKRLPEFMGTVLKAFGVDEHSIMHGNTLFSPTVLSKVKSERGYDLTPHLIGMFYDVGPRTDQIRCSYYDAMSALLEENFCKVAAQWLEKRGMQYVTASPHDEGELLDQTHLYGDVVRYFRSYHNVGGEDPFRTPTGDRRLYSAKFASSIAHLYERKRAIVMAYFFTGWGVTQAENLAWTNENYAYGMNFYDYHGVFHSLLGGWYDYAPPAVHFYQPYWRYWRTFADYVTRLSYIMSQGKHRADVALLYPGTTMHANWVAGRQSADPAQAWQQDSWQSFESPAIVTSERTKELARALVHDGIDLDVMDDWSLQRARIQGPILEVSGVELRAIVMPPLTTIRLATLEKIRAFYDAGGTVVCFERLPSASAENGRGDPKVSAAIEAIFGLKPDAEVSQTTQRTNARGGKSCFVPQGVHDVPAVLSKAIERDVIASEKDVFHTHQKVGEQDAYFLFNAQDKDRDLTVRFRVDGEPERWDAFTGEIQPIHRYRRDKRTTEVKLAMQPHEGVVVVFSPGTSKPAVVQSSIVDVASVAASGDGLLLQGFAETAGRQDARIHYRGQDYLGRAEAKAVPTPLELQGPFDFHLEPTMDNRWGDFRYPASPEIIGAEARRFRYVEEGEVGGTALGWQRPDFKDTDWEEVTYSYGPYWWHMGPFTEGSEPKKLLKEATLGKVDLSVPWPRLRAGQSPLYWKPYSFSKKFGAAYFSKGLGLSTLDGVSDNFLAFEPSGEPPGLGSGQDIHYLSTNVYSPNEADYTFYYGQQPRRLLVSGFPSHPVSVPRRTQAWLNGKEILWVTADENSEIRKRVRLRKGWNTVFLKIVQPEQGASGSYAVFLPGEAPKDNVYIPLLRWFREPQPLVYDIAPNKSKRVGWYRFRAPPGLRAMRLVVQAREITAWVDGRSVPVRDGGIQLPAPTPGVSQVVLRVVQEPGTYGGAVFHEPVAFTCEQGQIPLGDWSQYGLATYSGIGVYGKDITFNAQQLAGRVLLELGDAVTAAELLINGRPAGVKMSAPFRFDITKFVREGQNRVEIKIANTLANHMSTYPTPWVLPGQTVSGLLGPVRIRFSAPVTLTAGRA